MGLKGFVKRFSIATKRGANQNILAWVVGIAIILLAAQQLGFNLGTFFGVEKAPSPPGGLAPDGTCPIGGIIEDTTVTLDFNDKYDSSRAVGGGQIVTYRLNGGPLQTASDGGTITASPGNKIDIWGSLNLTAGATFPHYPTALLDQTIPCAGTKTYLVTGSRNATVGNDAFRVFNQEGNLIDETTNNETLGTGDVVSLRWDYQGTFERDTPSGIVVVAYNRSSYDDVILTMGSNLQSTGIPSQHASRGTAFFEKAFIMPTLTSSEIKTGTITIDVDDTVNPDAVALNVITFTFYDYSCAIKKDDTVVCDVVEDPDTSADIGAVRNELDAGTWNITVI